MESINNEFEHFEEDVEDDRDPDFIYSSSDLSSDENDVITENITSKGRPRKGRKPKYPGQNDNTRKSLKNSNLPHISKRGAILRGNFFIDYRCSCLNSCYENINKENRRAIFEKFWKVGVYDLQNAFICSLVKESQVKRRRKENTTNPREFTRTYTLEGKEVCRDLFVRTLQVSTKRVNTALKKSRTLDLIDHRGKHGKHFKIDEIRKQAVMEQISRIPKYKSHYRRAQTDREYLPTHMTIELMYSLYKEEVEDNPVSLSTYKKNILLRI